MRRISTTISHTISDRATVKTPEEKDLQIFTRWKRGVKKAIFETMGGRVSRGKNMPEKRNMGVNKIV